jgi:hypothetical protein
LVERLQENIKQLGGTEQEAELPDIEALEKSDSPTNSRGRPLARSRPTDSGERGPSGTPVEPGGIRRVGPSAGLEVPGGLYGVEQLLVESGVNEGERPMVIPELHVVKKGDTLWSLCSLYFSDPWRWPRLWAENALITNPHWIFPGDVVRLRAAGSLPEAVPPPPSQHITSNRRGSLESKAVVLRQLGFIEARDLQAAASVSGSREEKILLSAGDQAYLNAKSENPLRAGERYSVFVADRDHPVKSPNTGKVLGYIVRVYGDVMVDQITDSNMARGTLVDLTDPIERGYLVSPAIKQFKKVEPRPSGVTLEARVLASFTPIAMLAAENFVVLGRGKRDGIEVGNRTFVVRRGDGYRGVLQGWEQADPRFPKEIVGELWIVDVGEDASVAWIARTNKEIRIGDVTEMRKGH